MELGPYRLGREIGRGAFGIVFEALNTDTGEACAIKRVALASLSLEDVEALHVEITLLSRLVHPNIVRNLESIRTRHHAYIAVELCDMGSLSSLVRRFGALNERLAAIYTSQILSGLVYLVEQGVLHRDLKAANVLLSKRGVIKIADFGVATLWRGGGSVDSSSSLVGTTPVVLEPPPPVRGIGGSSALDLPSYRRRRRPGVGVSGVSSSSAVSTPAPDAPSAHVVGSSYWLAPECIELKGFSPASDVWSLGATVLELITGSPPYFNLAPLAAMYRIVSEDAVPLPPGLSPALQDFLTSCFRKDPAERPTAEDLLRHPFIVANVAAAARGGSGAAAVVSGAPSVRYMAQHARPEEARAFPAPEAVRSSHAQLEAARSSAAPAAPVRLPVRSWLDSLKRGEAPLAAGEMRPHAAARHPGTAAAAQGSAVPPPGAHGLGPRDRLELQELIAESLAVTRLPAPPPSAPAQPAAEGSRRFPARRRSAPAEGDSGLASLLIALPPPTSAASHRQQRTLGRSSGELVRPLSGGGGGSEMRATSQAGLLSSTPLGLFALGSSPAGSAVSAASAEGLYASAEAALEEEEEGAERWGAQREVERLLGLCGSVELLLGAPAAARSALQQLGATFRRVPPARAHFLRTLHGASTLVELLQGCAAAAAAAASTPAAQALPRPPPQPQPADVRRQLPLMASTWVLRCVNALALAEPSVLPIFSLVGLLPAALRFAAPAYPPPLRAQAAAFASLLCLPSAHAALHALIAGGGAHVLCGMLRPSQRPLFSEEALTAALGAEEAAIPPSSTRGGETTPMRGGEASPLRGDAATPMRGETTPMRGGDAATPMRGSPLARQHHPPSILSASASATDALAAWDSARSAAGSPAALSCAPHQLHASSMRPGGSIAEAATTVDLDDLLLALAATRRGGAGGAMPSPLPQRLRPSTPTLSDAAARHGVDLRGLQEHFATQELHLVAAGARGIAAVFLLARDVSTAAAIHTELRRLFLRCGLLPPLAAALRSTLFYLCSQVSDAPRYPSAAGGTPIAGRPLHGFAFEPEVDAPSAATSWIDAEASCSKRSGSPCAGTPLAPEAPAPRDQPLPARSPLIHTVVLPAAAALEASPAGPATAAGSSSSGHRRTSFSLDERHLSPAHGGRQRSPPSPPAAAAARAPASSAAARLGGPPPPASLLDHGESDDDSGDWMSTPQQVDGALQEATPPSAAASPEAAAALSPPLLRAPHHARLHPPRLHVAALPSEDAAAPPSPPPLLSALACQCIENLGLLCEVLLLFAQGDAGTKRALAVPSLSLLASLLRALSPSPAGLLAQPRFLSRVLLRALKVLRLVCGEPDGAEAMEAQGAVALLVSLLSREHAAAAAACELELGLLHAKATHSALCLLRTLLRVNRARQAGAAAAGLVPLLLALIREGAPRGALQAIAVPLLCDLASAGARARGELLAHAAHATLLELAAGAAWRPQALSALAAWVGSAGEALAGVLAAPAGIAALVAAFSGSAGDAREGASAAESPADSEGAGGHAAGRASSSAVLPSLVLIAERCPDVAAALSKHAFMSQLVARVASTAESPVTLKHLLALLRACFQAAGARQADLLRQLGLREVLRGVAGRVIALPLLRAVCESLAVELCAAEARGG